MVEQLRAHAAFREDLDLISSTLMEVQNHMHPTYQGSQCLLLGFIIKSHCFLVMPLNDLPSDMITLDANVQHMNFDQTVTLRLLAVVISRYYLFPSMTFWIACFLVVDDFPVYYRVFVSSTVFFILDSKIHNLK